MRPPRLPAPLTPLLSAACLSAVLLATAPVLAQGSPSADSIINSLRPGSAMGGGTRGIRPLGPAETPPPAPAVSGGAPASRPHLAGPAHPGHAAPVTARPGVSPAAPAPSGPAAATSGAPSVNLTVQFANNSDQLTPAAMRTLDELGRALSSQALSGYRFRIEGHTDSVGNHDHNLVLSQERAAKVVEYLTSKFGVERSRVESIGMGPDQPLVPTGPNVPEPRNRRVTVVNLGA